MLWRQREVKLWTAKVIPLAIILAVVVAFAVDAYAFSNVRQNNLPSAATTHSSRLNHLSMGAEYRPKNTKGFKIAIVGAGPSGLLLTHLLLKNDNDEPNHPKITLFDSRSDPRNNEIEGRAYALGIGIRGRTAIRRTDPDLWEAVKARGYESERFKLHLSISNDRDLVIPLRSESKKSSYGNLEPSLLIYQSELCATLLEKLEERQKQEHEKYPNNGLDVKFNTKVVDCNLDTMMIRVATNESPSFADVSSDTGDGFEDFGPFDLIVGCDGVNSRVRDSINKRFEEFATTSECLPGLLKVVRLDYPVGQTTDEHKRDFYDPKAVKLLFPSGAFIIPSGADGSCCILFSSRGSSDVGDGSLPVYLRETQNTTAVEEALREKFPRWREESFPDIATQLMGQDLRQNSAFKVTCNIYHYQNKAVLVGDAAHSTGGVSGQGLNSALMVTLVLYECLQGQGQDSHSGEQTCDLEFSLLEYSMRQVPEGRALYELFFGPNPRGYKKKFLWGLKTVRDALFQGKLGIGEDTLPTRLSSDLTPFSTIRRDRDYFYRDGNGDGGFPSEDQFRRQLEELHKRSYVTVVGGDDDGSE